MTVIDRPIYESGDGKPEKPPFFIKTEPAPKDVFDLSAAMEIVGGDKDLFREIVDIFFENLQGDLAKIKDSISKGDAYALERAAHALKGSVGNFGARRSHEAAYLLEKQGREKHLDESAYAFSKLECELSSLKIEIQNALKEM